MSTDDAGHGPAPHQIRDELPPILGTWPKVYVAVLIYLALVIAAFYAFTLHYAP